LIAQTCRPETGGCKTRGDRGERAARPVRVKALPGPEEGRFPKRPVWGLVDLRRWKPPLRKAPCNSAPVSIASRVIKFWAIGIGCALLLYVGGIIAVSLNQRRMIFFPAHDAPDGSLQPWVVGGRVIGYCKRVERPRTVWLMAHGNAGQASGRAYVLQRMAATDALFVVEYPGYGQRSGSPAMEAMNAAVAEAYEVLRNEFPDTPVCAIGESIGSGPASMLATLRRPPDKIVLAVPFDTLASVAAGHFRWLPVNFILKDSWDNIAALRSFTGPIDIFCAAEDRIIPATHARKLAAALPQARLVSFQGAHNEWANTNAVRIER
jgi:uncharacterized protein